ncbi:MAG: twitch domain-containing radical SAM protein [Flavobacteriales bacterium]|jgi:sulfatase maturation enzyme AslB (radical SAM superfamily)|nr:twitch domain-containing radical SAM protein [Flavobacteriales bacterium]
MSLPKELKDSFCLMPWVHLYIGTNGKANACCNTSITYGSVRNQSVETVWNGDKINRFRSQLLDGEKDKRCSICYHKEAAGKASIRTETLEKFSDYIPIALENVHPTKPVYLDIRYSNVCNLKCRTCWHGASSSWFEEAKVLKNNFGDKAIIKATTDNTKLIEDIVSYSDELEEVYFAGGEPLLMEEHYDFLDLLIQKQSFNTRIRYNTNLSQLQLKNKEVLAYWKQLKNVHLSISIDALSERVEVIRKGLKWEKLLQNIRKIKAECPHVMIEIAPTVSALNILQLFDLHRYFFEHQLIQSVDAIYLNLLERPNYYNIQVLPKEIKQKAKQLLKEHVAWLRKNKAQELVVDELKAIEKYLFAKDDEKGYQQLQQQVMVLNKMRNDSFSVF